MKTRLFVTTLLVAVTVSTGLSACGDKFFVPGRGARARARVDRQAAAVLLFVRAGTPFDETVSRLGIAETLRRAGYRPTIVGSPEDAARLANGQAWDVVLVDLGDAPEMATRVSQSGASVVPVAAKLEKRARDEARRTYRQVLALPARQQVFVDVIDSAVLARAKARRRASAGAGE